jgi:hypothetical protein
VPKDSNIKPVKQSRNNFFILPLLFFLCFRWIIPLLRFLGEISTTAVNPYPYLKEAKGFLKRIPCEREPPAGVYSEYAAGGQE